MLKFHCYEEESGFSVFAQLISSAQKLVIGKNLKNWEIVLKEDSCNNYELTF